jgi:hypothetical protein
MFLKLGSPLFEGETLRTSEVIKSHSILQGIKGGENTVYFKNPKTNSSWVEMNPDTVHLINENFYCTAVYMDNHKCIKQCEECKERRKNSTNY